MEEDLKKPATHASFVDAGRDIFVIVDGSAIVHRAYHAMPSLNRSDGTPTGAVHGFFSMLLRLIQEIQPKHIAVCFDRPTPNFRKELFKEYQAQRPQSDSDLSPQFVIIQNILDKAKIATYSLDGFEADDLIGTLAHEGVKVGDVSYVVTGDRDMMQLVNSRTKILMPIKGISEMKLFDEARVKEQFGVKPSEIVDLKALQGDSSDNYPGVPGVGPKTAAGLVEKYKTVEGIYKHIDEIEKENPKLAEKLKSGKESAKLCYQLATILQNVPFKHELSECDFKNISYEGWKAAFEDYEFKTLPKRLDEAFGNPSTDSGLKNGKKKDPMNQMKLI